MKKRLFGLMFVLFLMALLGSVTALAEDYPVYVNNTQVTDANKADILSDGGKAKYDSTSKTLTLNSPTFNTLKSLSSPQRTVYIYANDDLTIKGSATLENTDSSFTGICVLGNLTLTDANITVNSKKEGIYCQGKLTISSGTINATTTGSGQHAIHTENGGMEISGGNITANGSQITGTGIYTNGNDLTITGGTVTTNGYIGISSGHTVINGGTVTSTCKYVGITVDDITINGGTVVAKGTGDSSIGISAGSSNSTIKLGNNLVNVTAEGTESAITSFGTNTPFSLGDKLIIKKPDGGRIVTTGNKTVIQSGDTTAKSVEIVPGTAYTVTYKLQDNWITWSDGTTGNKTETVISGSKPANVPTGMKAPQIPGYEAKGLWYKENSTSETNPANETITKDTTFVYKITYITTKEELKKESTVYAGEVFVDGESQMQYLYSSDLSNQSQVFKNLKDALAGTAFSGLVPTITGQSENNGLAVSSGHQSEMQQLCGKPILYRRDRN